VRYAIVTTMPRPSKGDRRAVLVRPPTQVYDEIVKLSAAAGASCVSQYLCDVLAQHVGRTDLVRELNQEVLTLADTG